MQISIGIAAYNEEKNLPRLLKDLCAQDYPKDKIELVLPTAVHGTARACCWSALPRRRMASGK